MWLSLNNTSLHVITEQKTFISTWLREQISASLQDTWAMQTDNVTTEGDCRMVSSPPRLTAIESTHNPRQSI